MQPRILIADDDESIRLLLTTLLDEADYQTLAAENGRMAFDLAVEHRPDVAILDVMMPEMDGFAACRAMKSDYRTTDIPVLLLTALAQTPSKVEGLDCGASDYITKPFAATELLARVRAALASKGRRDALAAEAMTDALTGLANRRALESQLDHMVAHGQRNHEPLSVLMFDADRFKLVNDTFGHDVGDTVLAALARRSLAAVRAQDFLGRFGGEEFVAIMPSTGHEAALVAAERLRSSVVAEPIMTPCGPVHVTISVGVATAVGAGDTSRHALVAMADRALYSAKRAGRNRVVHADGQATAPLAPAEPPEAAVALLEALALTHQSVADHSRAVAELCWEVSVAMRLPAMERNQVVLAGLMHDIGILGAAPPITTSAPTEEPSLDEVRARNARAERLLARFPALHPVAPIVAASMERWDGFGVPRGLGGTDIPPGSRIVAVAHACEELRARGVANADIIPALRRDAGSRFDPRVVEAADRALQG